MKKYRISFSAFLLLFLFLITANQALAQQRWETIVGNPGIRTGEDIDAGDGSGSGGSGDMVSCPSNNFRRCLADQFNVSVAGSPRDSDLEATYRGYQIVSRYKRFYNAFKRGRITITYHTALQDGLAWARVFENGDMHLYRRIWTSSVRYQNYFMIHEGAHVADNYMDRSNQNLYFNAYIQGKDRDCFNSRGIITTYPWSVIGSVITLRNRQNESFAESVANTIQCKTGQACGPNGGSSAGVINDWPNKCSWIHNYILKEIN